MGDLRYADAGVDIDEGNRAVALIKRTVASTFTSGVLGGLGSFSGLFQIDTGRHRQPVLVASADGVGTKIKVAIATGRHRGIGTDLVNHCVNDILCCGADPLFFLDYFATGRLHPEQLAEIVEGIAVACSDAGCALIGGETAEMPGLYALADYDLAGFIVGIVERDGIIDGARVRAGDAVLGLPSSGLHTNGYSLVRHIVSENELDYLQPLPGTDRPLAELLLEPHRSYLHAVRELRGPVDVRALAHITGGGLKENVPRALPPGPGGRARPRRLAGAADLRGHPAGGRRAPRRDVAHLQHGDRHGRGRSRDQAGSVAEAAGIGGASTSVASSSSRRRRGWCCAERRRRHPRRRRGAGLGRGHQSPSPPRGRGAARLPGPNRAGGEQPAPAPAPWHRQRPRGRGDGDAGVRLRRRHRRPRRRDARPAARGGGAAGRLRRLRPGARPRLLEAFRPTPSSTSTPRCCPPSPAACTRSRTRSRPGRG